MTVYRLGLSFSCFALLNACSATMGDVQPYANLAPINAPQPVIGEPNAGGIYREGGSLNLFGDKKARNVGDLVTIQLTERTNAQTNASTAVNKSSDTNVSANSLFGGPVTVGGRAVLDAQLGSEREFAGDGKSTQSNRLEGSVTATVVQRLSNGNLVIQGSKQLRLNQGDELVQIQGIVRANDIRPDNTVSSDRVAEARIVYGGRGPIARSNVMGWLDRFFNSGFFPN